MIVLIDNGHGDNTPGKRSPDGIIREYKYTREIAAEVQRQLQERGYQAQLLVPEVNDISLGTRCNRANSVCKNFGTNNVILVSIHLNAAGNGKWMKATGWSAYTTKGVTKSDKLADSLYAAAKEVLPADKRIRTDYSDKDPDWEENFYILKHTLCPAVLTENFFQDNKEDVSYLLSLEGRNAIVRIHVEGIINYINSL